MKRATMAIGVRSRSGIGRSVAMMQEHHAHAEHIAGAGGVDTGGGRRGRLTMSVPSRK